MPSSQEDGWQAEATAAENRLLSAAIRKAGGAKDNIADSRKFQKESTDSGRVHHDHCYLPFWPSDVP
jgi:hypothetical protein